MKRSAFVPAVLAAAIAFFAGCHSNPPAVAGLGGSEVVGKLVDSKGAPVGGAAVAARESGDTAVVAKAVTNGSGRFSFGSLDSGVYTLSCSASVAGRTVKAFIPDVNNDRLAGPGETRVVVDVGTHTLLPPGTIAGRILLSYSAPDSMAGSIVFIPGTSYIAVTGDSGNFRMTGVPAGVWSVYASHAPEYNAGRCDSVRVHPDSTAQAPDITLALNPAVAPKPPRGLAARYDTLKGIVTLRWNRVPAADLLGYTVFRRDSGSTAGPQRVSAPSQPDTLFRDTVYKNNRDTANKVFFYQVTDSDSSGNTSLYSEPPLKVTAVSPARLRPVPLYIPPVTTVAFNGSVTCSVAVVNAFSDYRVFFDFNGSGARKEVSHVNGIADTVVSTGGRSAWGRIGIRITSARDTVDTGFTVRILPRPLGVIAADSTDSSITFVWNRSPDADFLRYEVYRRAQAATHDSLIGGSSRLTDTSCTFKTWLNGYADYHVTVFDTEGVSTAGALKRISIINSRPRFTTQPATLPGSAQVGVRYSATLASADRNNDPLSYTVISPAGGTCDSGVFTLTPSLDQGGVLRCAVTVRDGRGGADTISWNIAVATHEIWADGAPLLGGRRLCGAAVINGTIYAVGGCVDKYNGVAPVSSAIKTVEAYDTAAKKWVSKAQLASARWAPLCAAWNGRLYALGGFSERSYVITVIEEYDPAANTWTAIGTMPFTRAHGAACVMDNKLYCIGGSAYDPASRSDVAVQSIDVFDLAAKTWSKGPNLRASRSAHQAVAWNGKIFIMGGAGGDGDSLGLGDREVLKSVERFDPIAGRCDSVTAVSPRCNFGAALMGSTVYLIGGINSLVATDNAIATPDLLNLSLLNSSPGAIMQRPRHSCQAVALNGRIWVIGGTIDNSAATNRTLVYYP